jgi:hypothetical protein
MQCVIKGIGKKFEQRCIAKTNFIYVIGPIDQEAAPDHDHQYRKIDPVKPSNSERMFRYNFFHEVEYIGDRKVTQN